MAKRRKCLSDSCEVPVFNNPILLFYGSFHDAIFNFVCFRPPPPKSYSTPHKSGNKGSTSPMPPIVQRKPRKPPKLMHVLVPGEKRRVHDLAKENREDYLMDMDVPDDGTDYGDYTSKWEYLGNQVCSNYLKMYYFLV